MIKTAIISDDQRYRYRLTREWDETLPAWLFILLNPSKADAVVPDPTCTRCIDFVRRWGGGKLTIVNLFALRTTYPVELAAVGILEAEGPDNIAHVKREIRAHTGRIICGWGADPMARHIARDYTKLLIEHGASALRLTKDGQPGHPLYLPARLVPQSLVAA